MFFICSFVRSPANKPAPLDKLSLTQVRCQLCQSQILSCDYYGYRKLTLVCQSNTGVEKNETLVTNAHKSSHPCGIPIAAFERIVYAEMLLSLLVRGE